MAGSLDIIVGPPGSGKSEQSQRLAASHRYVHLSAGALLRAAAQPELDQEMAKGELVPSETTESVLEKALSSIDPELPILLDGFPRRTDEAKWLEQVLPKLGRQLGKVIFIDVSKEEALARLAKRGRADDQPTAEAERWHEYEHETEAAIDYYRHRRQLVEVDGSGSLSEVAARIAAVV